MGLLCHLLSNFRKTGKHVHPVPKIRTGKGLGRAQEWSAEVEGQSIWVGFHMM